MSETTKMETRCGALVWHAFSAIQCSRKAKVTHEGKHYCGVHDPVRRKARQDAKDKAWREERAAREDARNDAARKREADAARLARFDALAERAKASFDLTPDDRGIEEYRIMCDMRALATEAP